MTRYYFDVEGGSEYGISANSEMEAREQFRQMYPNLTIIKVWHA